MQCGLLNDKYIHHFLHQRRGNLKRHQKPPIINRGTFLRTISIDSVTREFIKIGLKSGKSYQIISLGSGFDTRLFRFVEEFDKKLGHLKYFEIDFDFVIKEKQRIIESTPELVELELGVHWCPIKLDLNCIKNEDDISILLKEFDFEVEAPTLIFAECCLMYLTASSGNLLISWATKTLKSFTFCSFDPVLSDDLESDRFAKTMLHNLQQRGLNIDALLAYPSKQTTLNRFLNHNISSINVDAFTMLQLEHDPETEFLISKSQRREMAFKAALDEYEEWNLLAQHYLLVILKSKS